MAYESGSDEGSEFSSTRREFTGVVASLPLIQSATDPAVADNLRDTSRASYNRLEDVGSIKEAFTPSEWLVLGPFQYQFPEDGTDHLVPSGGETAFATGETTGTGEQLFQSAHAAGATVNWEEVSLSEGQSRIPLSFGDNIDPTGGDIVPLFGAPGLTDDFQDWFGLGGILFATGYAFTTFTRRQAGIAVLESGATVWVNGLKITETPTAVPLQAGQNFVLVKQTLVLGSGSADLRFRPPSAPAEVKSGAVLPDLREGERTDQPASFELINTKPRALAEATLSIESGTDGTIQSRTVDIDPPLAPFETRWVNTRIQTQGATGSASSFSTAESDSETSVREEALATAEMARRFDKSDWKETFGSGDMVSTSVQATGSVTLTVTVDAPGGSDSRQVRVDIRDKDDPRQRHTFTSEIDEAVSEFAILQPTNVDTDDGPWELLTSLHGAGVPPMFNINRTKRMEDMYVMAPAARLGYNHEGLGRMDDIEALQVMKDRFDIDDENVYLSGHSMGGHGTWHVGLWNSDEFGALGPSAAWTDIETYIVDPFSRDKVYTYPGFKAIKDPARYRGFGLPKTENALDGTLSIFQLQGGADPVVPPLLPRTFVKSLSDQGLRARGEVGRRYPMPDPEQVDVAYLEVPGQNHFWDLGIAESGADALSHPDMIGFLRKTANEPVPQNLHFFTTNLSVAYQKYWVSIIEQRQVHAPTRVTAEIRNGTVHIETENVVMMAVDVAALRTVTGRQFEIVLNGESVQVPAQTPPNHYDFDIGDEPLVLNVRQGTVSSRGGLREFTKTPFQYGPLRQIHHHPYRLVYGTQGSEVETQRNLALANLRSQLLANRARAPGKVIPDRDVDESVQSAFNLVLFGRPSSNAITQDVNASSRVPISVRDGSVIIQTTSVPSGHRERELTYSGDLGVEYIYPNPNAPDRLVQVATGTSVLGLRLTGVHTWVYPQRATADYMVVDPSVRYQHWNGSRATGFFDTDWKVTETNGYLR